MTYKIAVCDDSAADTEYISALVKGWTEESCNIADIDTFPSSEAFLFHYADDKSYDILLLDIEMGDINGVELAKEIRAVNSSVQIIFITGYNDYISEGYEVEALHYLLKPISREKLFPVLCRAAEKMRHNEQVMLIESDGEMVRVPLCEIRFLEARQNYVTVHAKREYTVRGTLGETEKELDRRFFRTGRSFIVNLIYISRVTKTDIYLSDGSVVPLPRGMFEPLNRAIISMN